MHQWISEVLDCKAYMKNFFLVEIVCLYFSCISTKVVKAALALSSGFGDRKYNSSVNKLLSDMLR